MSHAPRGICICLFAIAAMPACDPFRYLDQESGNSHKGYFWLEPAAGRLALGSNTRMTLRDNETLGTASASIKLVLGTPSPTGIIEVTEQRASDGFWVRAVDVGRATLSFSGVADGKRKKDALEFEVVAVQSVELDSPCVRDGVVLRGGRIEIGYRFNPDGPGRTLGEGLYPITIDPPTGLVLSETDSDLQRFAFAVPPDAPDEVAIRSALEGDSAELRLRVADLADVGATYSAPETGYVGKVGAVSVAPVASAMKLCGTFPAHVYTKSPEVCMLLDNDSPVEALDAPLLIVRLRYVAPGDCSVAFDAAGLTGVRLPTITVEPDPADD